MILLGGLIVKETIVLGMLRMVIAFGVLIGGMKTMDLQQPRPVVHAVRITSL